MWLTICFLALSVSATFSCEYSRISGLFRSQFTKVAEDNFVADDGGDTLVGYGHNTVISLTNSVRLYSATTFNRLRIYDNGYIEFYDSSAMTLPAVVTYDGTTSPFTLADQAFAAAHWFKDDSGAGISYTFTYKHLLRSAMTENGADIGPSMCDLQRIQSIIGDCSGDGSRSGTLSIDEAVIATWQISEAAEIYHFQTIVAVNSAGNTYVIFLYDDPINIPADVTGYTTGYITGNDATASSKNAGVCPYTGSAVAANSRLNKESNCRCGTWNEGIYVFETEDGNECGKNEADFTTECSRNLEDDTTINFNLACRPSRNLRDTCLETVLCLDKVGSKEVNIKVRNPPHGAETAVRFVDPADFLSTPKTITQITNPACQKLLTQEGSSNIYSATFTLDDAVISDCGWDDPNDDITFIARIYDSTQAEMEVAGDIYLKATCDILNTEQSTNVKHGVIAEYEIPYVSGRRIEMFINTQKYYEYNSQGTTADTQVPANAILYLGDDIYIAIGYDWGSRTVLDKIEPYGIYAYDCWVANNADFLTTGTNRATMLTTAESGCVNPGIGADKAFYMDESFKLALRNAGTVDFVRDADINTYNYVITASAFDAARWLIGGSSQIHFKCSVGLCRNQDYGPFSRCSDVCNNIGIDYDTSGGRRKRDTNETSDPHITVQTSVTVLKRDEKKQPVECISNVVAYSTLLALTVLLLVAMGVTLMLFVRLAARQRKRI